jgi:hypothetical protein
VLAGNRSQTCFIYGSTSKTYRRLGQPARRSTTAGREQKKLTGAEDSTLSRRKYLKLQGRSLPRPAFHGPGWQVGPGPGSQSNRAALGSMNPVVVRSLAFAMPRVQVSMPHCGREPAFPAARFKILFRRASRDRRRGDLGHFGLVAVAPVWLTVRARAFACRHNQEDVYR